MLLRLFLLVSLVGFWVFATASRADLEELGVVGSDVEPSVPLRGKPDDNEVVTDNPTTLQLCECEAATGPPNGLSCPKEGWFISNFEQAGQWLNGGGLVPLSRAICCRPCLPKELPGSKDNSSALALMSVGCHASSNAGSSSLRCEATGGSFVSGWSEAVQVPNSAQFYYPVGAVDCCTPTLLLSNGEARELERCECVQENDINCGGQGSGRMLAGYMRWGISQFGEFVPIAPALCCKSCISDKVISVDSCYDLNYCSGHGVCNLGTCECAEGFAGADCRHKVGGGSGGVPQWLVSIIIISSCTAFSILIIVIGKVIRHFTNRPGEGEEVASEEGEQLLEPLIVGLASDDEGSVGSEDTTDHEDDDEASMPPPIRRQQREEEMQEAVGGGQPVTPEEQQQTQQQRTETFEISQNAADRQQETQDGPTEEALDVAQVHADEAVIEGIRRAEAIQSQRGELPSGSEERQGGLGHVIRAGHKDVANPKEGSEDVKEAKERGGIPGIECSVCLNRPVQVAVVPCGHMCMCRRCSRRLRTCPVCRCRIIRRQRVFMGG